MTLEEKAIASIEKKISELKSVNTESDFTHWTQTTFITLSNIYPPNDSRIALLKFPVPRRQGRTAIFTIMSDATSLAEKKLVSLIDDIKQFGVPKPQKKASSNKMKIELNNTNTQTQANTQTTTVTVQLDFLVELLKDELKGSQIKELKAILESKENPTEKKKSFMDKLKSFGGDVASNILANLMTNPQVYAQLGNLL